MMEFNLHICVTPQEIPSLRYSTHQSIAGSERHNSLKPHFLWYAFTTGHTFANATQHGGRDRGYLVMNSGTASQLQVAVSCWVGSGKMKIPIEHINKDHLCHRGRLGSVPGSPTLHRGLNTNRQTSQYGQNGRK